MEPVRDFWSDLKRDVKDRRSLGNALRFAAVFAVCFAFSLYAAVPALSGFWTFMGEVHAQAVQGLLSSAFGIESSVAGNILGMEVGGEEVLFSVSQLCSGDIEIALMASLLIASFDVLLIWRLLGIALGAGLLLAMNPVRIAITLVITRDSGMEAGDLYHTVIFRLFLFVVLVLYYLAWYRAFAGRESKLQERLCKRLRF